MRRRYVYDKKFFCVLLTLDASLLSTMLNFPLSSDYLSNRHSYGEISTDIYCKQYFSGYLNVISIFELKTVS